MVKGLITHFLLDLVQEARNKDWDVSRPQGNTKKRWLLEVILNCKESKPVKKGRYD